MSWLPDLESIIHWDKAQRQLFLLHSKRSGGKDLHPQAFSSQVDYFRGSVMLSELSLMKDLGTDSNIQLYIEDRQQHL